MVDHITERVSRRNRHRSIAISYRLIQRIEEVTKGHISVSAFIRMAVAKELEKYDDER